MQNLTATGDWYSDGFDRMIKDIAANLALPQNVVAAVYRGISDFGLTDYDIEKEVIWDRYFSDEE